MTGEPMEEAEEAEQAEEVKEGASPTKKGKGRSVSKGKKKKA